ncbi:unnamed protein product, partial [marine sediment metagenome]
DGFPISWRESLLRDSVGLAFGALAAYGALEAAVAMPLTIEPGEWTRLRQAHSLDPPWVAAAGQFWVVGEVAVVWFDRKRRALHDFLAGTVVIHKDSLLPREDD